MIPVYLDPAAARVALVGRGSLAVRRLAWLRDLGADPAVFSDAPTVELRRVAGARLQAHLPDREEIAACRALWVADLEPNEAEALAAQARAAGVLINVEDNRPLCDFHTPAVLRRGALVLAAGTGGASPAVAKAARERLGAAFPPVWGEALADIAAARETLRAQRAGPEALSADAKARLSAFGLAAADELS